MVLNAGRQDADAEQENAAKLSACYSRGTKVMEIAILGIDLGKNRQRLIPRSCAFKVKPVSRGRGMLCRLLCVLRRQGFVPTVIVTDKLRSYGAALREIGFSGSHEQGLRRQQSSGEFSSAASTTRTKDARFQINQVGPAFCFRPCGRLQHIQCTTTFNQASDASTVPDRSA